MRVGLGSPRCGQEPRSTPPAGEVIVYHALPDAARCAYSLPLKRCAGAQLYPPVPQAYNAPKSRNRIGSVDPGQHGLRVGSVLQRRRGARDSRGGTTARAPQRGLG